MLFHLLIHYSSSSNSNTLCLSVSLGFFSIYIPVSGGDQKLTRESFPLNFSSTYRAEVIRAPKSVP